MSEMNDDELERKFLDQTPEHAHDCWCGHADTDHEWDAVRDYREWKCRACGDDAQEAAAKYLMAYNGVTAERDRLRAIVGRVEALIDKAAGIVHTLTSAEPSKAAAMSELLAIAKTTDHRIGLHYADPDCPVCWAIGRVPLAAAAHQGEGTP